jgi:mannose-P-dolichol utilization defect protein 1
MSCMMESVERYQLPARECALPLLSKFLGYAIIVSSVFLKVPQIWVIVKNRSIKGLSVASFELEVAGFTIALAYCRFKQLPFSAYGEIVFILAQSVVCLGLIYYYSPKLGAATWAKTALYCAVTPALLGGNLDATLFEALYALQHAIFFFARIPQIIENFQTKSTGQLSFSTNLMSFGGCVVRTFTSVQEHAPVSMLVGCLLGLLTNGVVCAQIMAYAPPPAEKKVKKVE